MRVRILELSSVNSVLSDPKISSLLISDMTSISEINHVAHLVHMMIKKVIRTQKSKVFFYLNFRS